jgi:uncharacterized membrane protein
VRSARRARIEWQKAIIIALAFLFFALTTWGSYTRWANFGYRTFDLAYYVQATWQLIHGRFDVSVEYVPLLGNHVEPIVILAAPFFFLFRHPLLFVVLQNAALAAMGPIGYAVAKRLGLARTEALVLAVALLVFPATGYIALHEFHPEALAAPFLLLMLRARLAQSLRQHWVWFIAVLACKENMALLLIAYCAGQCVWERKAGWSHLRAWFVLPMAVALGWFVLCAKVITPALNAGNIDYGALYNHLGKSGGEIVWNAFTHPQIFAKAFAHAAAHGNLIWALFLPLLCLPLLRPKWILISAPIFLQHLLSWRASEWTIYFHYAAPLVPLLWFATAEVTTMWRRWFLPAGVLCGCVAAQIMLGPFLRVAATTPPGNAAKHSLVSEIPTEASVVAPLPYLSHLAMRQELHSLHYIFKGLKTLSRQRFVAPAPADFVLIDYGDSATFDAKAGYYHPPMRTVEGEIVPSSDVLLHEYLRGAAWDPHSVDEVTLLRRRVSPPRPSGRTAEPLLDFGGETKLVAIRKSGESISDRGSHRALEIVTTWSFGAERSVFPWLELYVTNTATGERRIFTRGLCAPEASEGESDDLWRSTRLLELPSGSYALEAHFFDQTKRAWGQSPTDLVQPISLGTLQVKSRGEP